MPGTEHEDARGVAARCIGIRAAPQKVTYSILERSGRTVQILDVAEVVLPTALDTPERLRYLRTTVLDILEEYQIAYAGLRLAEGNATNKNSDRIGLEAVLQELLSSSPVRRYFCGRLPSIAARLGTTAKSLKEEIGGTGTSPRTSEWAAYNVEQRESILVAQAALGLEEVGA